MGWAPSGQPASENRRLGSPGWGAVKSLTTAALQPDTFFDAPGVPGPGLHPGRTGHQDHPGAHRAPGEVAVLLGPDRRRARGSAIVPVPGSRGRQDHIARRGHQGTAARRGVFGFYTEFTQFAEGLFKAFQEQNVLDVARLMEVLKKAIGIVRANRSVILRFGEFEISTESYLVTYSVNTALLAIALGTS